MGVEKEGEESVRVEGGGIRGDVKKGGIGIGEERNQRNTRKGDGNKRRKKREERD